ncbi:LysR family transcriptional regulator [Rubrivivax albus]|uniref:LysR family transcriptional regulator n=2 Tax=Rubrivivax albus TaxID=2499835 RepID=A0A437JZQ4_9BURK|nr:LysR family transcriptional regulator [Rubrivivax albus]
MHSMNVGDIDLNLLHVFAAVHQTGSVSRAAERLGLSQPAASHALTRLRLLLHDPLFVRAPGGVRPTPRAERLAPQVVAALQLLDAALQESDRFDAAKARRRFVLHMSDIGADEFLPLLLRDLAQDAPGVTLEVVQRPADAIGPALEQGRLDLAFGYLPGLAGSEQATLLTERYVVLLRRGHPLSRALRGRAALQTLEFVVVHSHAVPARALQQLGLESRIRLTLPHFMVVPPILEATDLALVLPHRPAARFAARHALQVVEVDLGLPPFPVAMHWHWRHTADPGHRWLRERALAMRFGPAAGVQRSAASRPKATRTS